MLEEHDRVEVLDLVEALVDKSLLMVTDVDGLRRYRYLETLRSYAEERGEDEVTVPRCDCCFTTISARSWSTRSTRCSGDRTAAQRGREPEIPNLRRVFDDALDRGDVAAATAVIAPFAEMVGGIDWRITGWAAEALRPRRVGR